MRNRIGGGRRATGGDTGAFLTLAGIGIIGCLVCIGLRQIARFNKRTSAALS